MVRIRIHVHTLGACGANWSRRNEDIQDVHPLARAISEHFNGSVLSRSSHTRRFDLRPVPGNDNSLGTDIL